MGIVYGDLGTSCLYTIKESFNPANNLELSEVNILGILSLIFWTMTFVIIFKYLTFITMADNAGEGGMMALISLIFNKDKKHKYKFTGTLILLGIFGTSLLLSEGVLTPSITVLSAIEGLEVITPVLKPIVIPITIIILIGLFLLQRRGTGGISAIFGPLMLCWFVMIGVFGLIKIIEAPIVLKALNPFYAINFFLLHKVNGFFVLGAVVLCITGGEALYADMGHFGKKPIKVAWIYFVYPCLLFNYFGQGSNLLMKGSTILANPFYSLTEGWLLYPMIIIATIASIIASQALISGAFSLSQQAMQLGFLPRLNIIHTSYDIHGQIYISEINNILMIACIILVTVFKNSSNLASAYGMSVMGAMTITSILFCVVAIRKWHWKKWQAFSLCGLFLIVDISYLTASLTKLLHGAWLPLITATAIYTLMLTWKKGREYLAKSFSERSLSLDIFMKNLDSPQGKIQRVNGTAVFMSPNINIVPMTLLHHFKHNKVLHQTVILLSVQFEKIPEVDPAEKIKIIPVNNGFYQIHTYFGYMEKPDIPLVLKKCRKMGLEFEIDNISYYLGRETLLTSGRSKMAIWQKYLFSFLAKNARPASSFFKLPPNRVIELGLQVEI